MHSKAGAVQALAEQTHFRRRAGEAVDQQHTAAATLEEKVSLLDHAFTLWIAGRVSFNRQRSLMPYRVADGGFLSLSGSRGRPFWGRRSAQSPAVRCAGPAAD